MLPIEYNLADFDSATKNEKGKRGKLRGAGAGGSSKCSALKMHFLKKPRRQSGTAGYNRRSIDVVSWKLVKILLRRSKVLR